MFESSWSPEDQQAFDRIAKKLDINLEANDLAGSEATFTLALQKKSAMPPSKDYEGYATRVL